MHYKESDYLGIDTPENVVFGYQLAGLGSRFLAALFDTVFLIILAMLFLIAQLSLSSYFNAWDLNENWVVVIFTVFYFLIYWGYYITFELVWNGQSPGKRLARLRVVQTNGIPLTFGASLIRNLVRTIDFIPLYGIGAVTMFISRQSRRLGDYAAGTLVVHDRTIGLHELNKKKAWEIDPKMMQIIDLPLNRLNESDVQLAEEYLSRRHELAPAPQLLHLLLKKIYGKLEAELPEPMLLSEATELLGRIAYSYRNNP